MVKYMVNYGKIYGYMWLYVVIFGFGPENGFSLFAVDLPIQNGAFLYIAMLVYQRTHI